MRYFLDNCEIVYFVIGRSFHVIKRFYTFFCIFALPLECKKKNKRKRERNFIILIRSKISFRYKHDKVHSRIISSNLCMWVISLLLHASKKRIYMYLKCFFIFYWLQYIRVCVVVLYK